MIRDSRLPVHLPDRCRRWAALLARHPRLRRAARSLCGGRLPDDPRTIALSDAELVRLCATLCDRDDLRALLTAALTRGGRR
jgi:hypothetical protein